MKIVAFFLLSSLTVALVLAFPDSHNAIDTMPTAELPPAAGASASGEGTTAPSSTTDQLRRPRHFLTKLFSPQPQVIVQPIVVQPLHHHHFPHSNIFNGGGRDFNYHNGFGRNGFW